jgi:hypothetical protein
MGKEIREREREAHKAAKKALREAHRESRAHDPQFLHQLHMQNLGLWDSWDRPPTTIENLS